MRRYRVSQDIFGGEREGAVISTGYGGVLVTASLTHDEFVLLRHLQDLLLKQLDASDRYIESVHRPVRRGDWLAVPPMPNGDILHKFDDLPPDRQLTLSEQLTKQLCRTVTVSDLTSFLHSLSRIH
jgi:hypothetical protein